MFPQKKNYSTLIVGIGSALVDILLKESDGFLTRTGAAKGGMTLVDHDRIEAILAQSGQTPAQVPGGSACNTIIGIGNLAKEARFIGKRGRDSLGELFETSLRSHHVEPVLDISDTPTGRVLSVITPDAQRSMFTCLGAAAEAKPEEITAEKFAGAALVHIEGYLLFNELHLMQALKAAREAGALISLDCASYTVVEASKAILRDIIREFVDIVLANEDEARVYTGSDNEEKALDMLAQDASVAVVKIGKRGSLIARGTEQHRIGIYGTGAALDTTGAGDLWASGFLYGYVHGFPLKACGTLGAACGYEVCQVIGAQIPEQGWQRIRKYIPE